MKLKIRVPEFLYILSYSFYLIGKILSVSTIPTVFPLFQTFENYYYYLCVIPLLVKFVIDRSISFNSLVKSSLLAVLIIVSAISSKNLKYLSYFFLLIFSTKNVDIRNVIKYFCGVLSFLLVLVFIGYWSGVLPNYYAISGGSYRNSLGYKYITYAPNLFFHLELAYLYVRGNKIRFRELLFLFAIGFYLYVKTNTESAFYLGTLAIILVLILKLFKIKPEFKNWLTNFIDRWLLLISAIVPIALSILYGTKSNLLKLLDSILSNRLRLGYEAINNYGIKLFGQEVDVIGTKVSGIVLKYDESYNFIDSSFLRILLIYGVVIFLFLIISYIILGYKNPYRTITYSVCFMILVLHSIWDPQFFDIFYNPFLIFIGVLFSQTNDDIEHAISSRY